MTSPAIQLAMSLGLVPDNTHPTADTRHMRLKREKFESFYAKAQAQALRDAGEYSYNNGVPLLRDDLLRMAEKLERKA